ncbi:MAG: CHAT domain-containing protein, partial [Saprospiraceae bacterium]|nr:CHAT domain-containing protein [Saprospiraceae bacterium]
MKVNKRLIPLSLITLLSFFGFSHSHEYEQSYSSHALVIRADSFSILEQWQTALDLYKKAEFIFEKEQDWLGYIYTQNEIGYCIRRQRKPNDAKRQLYLALDNGIKLLGPEHTLVARTYHHLGDYYFFIETDPDSAYYFQNLALSIIDKDSTYAQTDLVPIYKSLGRYRWGEEEFQEAAFYYEKAMIIQEESFDSLSLTLAHTYLQLGICYRPIGDYERAKNFLHASLHIYDSYSNPPPSNKSRAYNSLANTYLEEDNFITASEIYGKAISFTRNVYGGRSQLLVTPLTNQASAYWKLGMHDQARNNFTLAIEINAGKTIVDLQRLANTYEQFAEFYLRIMELDSSRFFLLKSLEIQKRIPLNSPTSISKLYYALAEIAKEENNIDEALLSIERALQLLEPDFDQKRELSRAVTDVSDDHALELMKILSLKAQFLHSKYKNTGNQTYLEESLSYNISLNRLSNQIRNGPYSNRSKLLLSRYIKQNASQALKCIADLDRLHSNKRYVEIAFNIMENNRYARIRENLSKMKTEVPVSVHAKEMFITSQSQRLRQALSKETDSLERTKIQQEIFEFDRQYQNFRREISEEYPSYFGVKFDSMLTLPEIQERLGLRTQVLEFFWGDSVLFVISFSKNHHSLTPIPITSILTRNISTYQEWMISESALPSSNYEYADFASVSHDLFRILLQPYIKKGIKRLVISGDGPLSLIPFGTFVTDNEPNNFRKAPYYLHIADIQYVYSCNLWLKTALDRKLSKPSILAFSYSNQTKFERVTERNDLIEIPESGREVRLIRKLFNRRRGKFLTAENASETAFKSLVSDYDIVHMALHGVADTSNEIDSRLEFRAGGETNDGRLYAHELYNIKLDKLKLAVLSACETGIGKEFKGEGVFSIARGFYYAGCPSIIMSLWKVDDKSTADIMHLFYKYLLQGQPTSEAIRRAKLTYLMDAKLSLHTLPSYWAAFVP